MIQFKSPYFVIYCRLNYSVCTEYPGMCRRAKSKAYNMTKTNTYLPVEIKPIQKSVQYCIGCKF